MPLPEAFRRRFCRPLVSAGAVMLLTPSHGVINKLLLELRNSLLPLPQYDRLANLFKTVFLDPYSLIPEWD